MHAPTGFRCDRRRASDLAPAVNPARLLVTSYGMKNSRDSACEREQRSTNYEIPTCHSTSAAQRGIEPVRRRGAGPGRVGADPDARRKTTDNIVAYGVPEGRRAACSRLAFAYKMPLAARQGNAARRRMGGATRRGRGPVTTQMDSCSSWSIFEGPSLKSLRPRRRCRAAGERRGNAERPSAESRRNRGKRDHPPPTPTPPPPQPYPPPQPPPPPSHHGVVIVR